VSEIRIIPRQPTVYLRKDNWLRLMKFCVEEGYVDDKGRYKYAEAINDLLDYAFRMREVMRTFKGEVIGIGKKKGEVEGR